MKKLALATVVAAAAIGAYIYTQQPQSAASGMASFVPADTVWYSAQQTPFPIRAYLKASAASYRLSDGEMQQLQQSLQQAEDVDEKFFLAFLLNYLQGMNDPDQLVKDYGLGDTVRFYTYGIGAAPVFKWEVENPDAFWQTLGRIEAQSGAMHHTRTVGGLEARVYDLALDDVDEQLELWFAEVDGMMTMVIGAPLLDARQLAIAFAQARPAQALADTGILDEIRQRNRFHSDDIGYISHQQLLTGLMTPSGNTMAKQISRLTDDPQELAQLQDPVCYEELSAIAANWPRTVFQTEIHQQGSGFSISSDTIIESRNQPMLSALNKLRGFVPQSLFDAATPMFAAALGINADTLQEGLVEVRDQMLEVAYQCPQLAQLQQELKQVPPESLALFSGFTDGIQGLGLGIYDYAFDDSRTDGTLSTYSMLMSVSAKDPAKAFNAIKMVSPELASLNLKPGQEAVDIKDRVPQLQYALQPIMLQMSDSQLMLHTGDKGASVAEAMGTEVLAANGLMAVTLDYQRAMLPAMDWAKALDPELVEQLQSMQSYDLIMKLMLDVDDRGLVLHYQGDSDPKRLMAK
ncbi:hypothetical protein SAMN04488540_1269 [Ferrimonas sediminum]|uniref:DUF3352 domain-containing protein n=1 Tax=Ferrimonas sediminum TaxID=718193 RepID=A0A1G9AZA1_9GAMM|nr:hypothetical protein [Ferrimonas sediminum]SDK32659.1 hypothetical protein SAMN04488540_1269 [Ferrimonas sediminum]